MSAVFDEKEFSAALSEFIINMEELPNVVGHPSVNRLTERLCRVLRISMFELTLFENSAGGAPSAPEEQHIVFFSKGECDTLKAYRFRKRMVAGNVEYVASPYAGSADWSDEERKGIEVFIKTMFVFNGRAKVMGLAESLVFYDKELGIHTLNYFMQQGGMRMAKGELFTYTCCRFNLIRFSVVNRRLGRNSGTDVMRKFINGLSMIAGEDGMVCRIGGDNFIALFSSDKTEQITGFLSGTVINTGVSGLEKITVSARGGFCPVTPDCRTLTDVMDRVTAAESMAKNNRGTPFVFFDDKTRQRTENAKWAEGLFGDAIKNEEFLVYYQPKVDLRGYSLAGAEALCRWRHDGELIPPMRFIPVFEQSNNICVLDFYMLEHICRDIRRWLNEGTPVVKVSVNMSRVHLGSEDLAEQIIRIIRKYDIPNEYIEIELTETTTDVDFSELKRVVAALHNEGICTSVDDFGVGYSSLNLIRELPWNVLKIDKSFLPEDIDENSRQKKIMLKYVIAMAQNLGLECIVEGVETINQVALLKEYGCYRAQGFYFDRPLPVEQFEKRLRSIV